jgi:hypothetical protein
MKKHYGNYLGLVVEDYDPLFRNRIKVFVPAISATLLSKINTKRKDVTVAALGVNLPHHLDDDAYQELVKILPWAECAAPLFGGGTSSHYNRQTKTTTNKNNPGDSSSATPTGNVISPYDVDKEGKQLPAGTSGDATRRSEYGKESDAFSGKGISSRGNFNFDDLTDAQFNKIKFVASIGYRETGFSISESTTDSANGLADKPKKDANGNIIYRNGKPVLLEVRNANVLREYNRLTKRTGEWNPDRTPDPTALALARQKYGDYGIYQVNQKDGPSSLNGRGQASTTTLEQTLAIVDYIDSTLSKQKRPNYQKTGNTLGVSELIAAGQFQQAELKLNGFWHSLPKGGSHKPGTDAVAYQIQNTTRAQAKTGQGPLSLAVNTTPYNPNGGNASHPTDTAVARLLADRKMKINENSYDVNATYTTGLPGGIFSTPKINSHVWVFFNDGDPQYPVYFAQHVVVADWQRIKETGSPGISQGNNDTEFARKNTSAVAQAGAGIVQFITQHEVDPTLGTMRDDSGIKISGTNGGMISLMSTGNVEYAPVNKTTKVAGDNFLTVEGAHQVAVKSSLSTVVAEDHTTIIGDVSPESIAAAKKIKEILKPGHMTAIEAHKEPSGKRVKCPQCYENVISEKGTLVSKLLTRVVLGVWGGISRATTYAPKSVGEVLKTAVAPLKNTTPKKIRKGDCGNPNCVNGTIPEYNSNIPKIEEESTAFQESVFDSIVENEQQLGVGGNQVTIISKNKLVKVGLITNDLPAHVEVPNAIPIPNGMEFADGHGPLPAGDSVSMYKTIDTPGAPTGFYELFVGSKYQLKVGSRGIHMETTGNIEINGGHFELTSNFISLGNNKGITKITGAAVQIEAAKSIIIGDKPTNVHIKGNAHIHANLTTQGSVYANGTLYAKRLVIPAAIQKTDMTGAADYTSGLAVYNPVAAATFGKNIASKIPTHYNPILHGLYPATQAGMNDILVDWLTVAQMSNFYDNWGAPTGIFFGVGSGPVFTWPHIHLHHNTAHEHSYKGPDGMYVNDADEVPRQAALCGGAITAGEQVAPDLGS